MLAKNKSKQDGKIRWIRLKTWQHTQLAQTTILLIYSMIFARTRTLFQQIYYLCLATSSWALHLHLQLKNFHPPKRQNSGGKTPSLFLSSYKGFNCIGLQSFIWRFCISENKRGKTKKINSNQKEKHLSWKSSQLEGCGGGFFKTLNPKPIENAKPRGWSLFRWTWHDSQ